MSQKTETQISIEAIKEQFPLVYEAIIAHGREAAPAATSKPTAPAPQEKDLGVNAEKFALALNKQKTPAAPPPAPQMNEIQTYEKLLNGYMAGGMTKGSAFEKLAKEYPDFHAKFLQAFNQPKPEPPKQPVSKFEGLVSSHMEVFKCSKGDAIQAVARINPEAHAAYIQGVNS